MIARAWLLCLAVLVSAPTLVLGQAPPPPLTADQVATVQTALAAMRADPRGPYLRIRWFCKDGTVLPPGPSACAPHGGGVQHAEFNDSAKRLAALRVHVGTIYQATDDAALFDEALDHYRLRELALNRYLEDIDNGWVLERARSYRGARQIEDEEARGEAFLTGLLARPAWTGAHFLLAMQTVAVVPHVRAGGGQTVQRARNLATELAELDRRFEPIRAKIHSFPGSDDLAAVERFARGGTHSAEVTARLSDLTAALTEQYDQGARLRALEWYAGRVGGAVADSLRALASNHRNGEAEAAFRRTAALSRTLRARVTEGTDGRQNLLLLDLNHVLQEQAFHLASSWGEDGLGARLARLGELQPFLGLLVGAGLLSPREQRALTAEIARLGRTNSATALDYKQSVDYLSRALSWSMGTIRGTYGLVVGRYAAFEPKASGFEDALARGSVLLPLASRLEWLSADADRALGAAHELFDQRVSQGVKGLNPGVSQGVLEILSGDSEHWEFRDDRIYVVPSTIPELKPVAGVLTLDEGNLLSHVQLLARNLGIPNASVSSEWLPRLREMEGRPVFYAVSPLGRVVLKDPARLSAAERALVERKDQTNERVRLDTSRLRLDQVHPVPLRELRANLSGVVVGPKAANLGELAAFFPDRVSAGVALPFGMFNLHVNRPFDSDRTVSEELREAYRQANRMRAEGTDEQTIDRYMFERLAWVRRAIQELPWIPEVRADVERALDDAFGDRLDRGVFVRSDTNVEDLPQFSGAGLNLTVAHLRTKDAILESIRRVWTSPFTERAYLWRKQVLEEVGEVYPSILLLESVPSEKSGVMITSGLQEGGPRDLTIATAEGVGGAVEGEDAETVLVRPNGTIRLLSQAKAPLRRVLVQEGPGGVRMVAARRPTQLINNADVLQLRHVIREWTAQHGDDQVWDIEFGFVGPKLWLFQIRPFVRFRSSAALDRLRVLDGDVTERGARSVQLR